MALLREEPVDLIHHSDRGIQYCSSSYVKLLRDNNITISMTENGDPLENAIAERINGILKQEYLECYQVANMEQARELLDQCVLLYNEERPHMSIANKVPNLVHIQSRPTERIWKSYYKRKEDLND